MTAFRRDRLTWVLYLLLAWFAYLQAAPGLVVPRLRDELGFGYAVAGMHVAAFAAGAAVAGAVSPRLERAVGRTGLLWSATVVLAAGAVALTLAGAVMATIGAITVMGLGALGGGSAVATAKVDAAGHAALVEVTLRWRRVPSPEVPLVRRRWGPR